MSNTFMTKRKTATAVIAVVLSALIIFGGTFAWTSISQQALNEVAATRNPGGRLHDDFVDITYGDDDIADYDTMKLNKDVYAENFTSIADNGVQVYARVRLDEYMEIGLGAGKLNADGTDSADDNQAKSLMDGATLANKATWTTHIPTKDDPFHKYWTLETGGKTTYMPTFNKNKDSLDADINGTFQQNFTDHLTYTTDSTTGAIFEEGVDTLPYTGEVYQKIADAEYADGVDASGNPVVRTVRETHTAKETLEGSVITMDWWINNLNCEPGNYWVWDDDGWAYWANPIDPSTSTGLLLDAITRTQEPISDDWYYAINVVAQFITKDDLGQGSDTGFYDPTDGSQPPSDEALMLLSKIGVEVDFEVGTAQELQKALSHGGNITLTNSITVDTNLVVTADTVLDLGTNTITGDGTITADGDLSLISVQGADTELTIKGGTFTAAAGDGYVVDVRDGAKVIIDGGTYSGNTAAVYVYEGTALINGGSFSLQQAPYTQLIDADDTNFAAETAKLYVCGGSYTDFDPTAASDGNLVPTGYEVSSAANVYTVTTKAVPPTTTRATTTTTTAASTDPTTDPSDATTDPSDATTDPSDATTDPTT